ncbi:MAG: InlB B-repeat-containing protein [Bacilli bacterium]|nr:InlB B-repeat-containing protein [Bacilli bacterium]
MKKSIFAIPLMAISLLASCGGKPSPTPEEDVKFSATSIVTLDDTKQIANISLDWTPTDHLIECSDFTFTLNNQSSITSTIVPGELGSRPLNLTITFASALSTDDKGYLKFHYNDKTAKKDGEGMVENINIKIAGEKPSFSVTASTVEYDEGTHSAMVELNWEPASASITFSNLDFTYGTRHADEVTAEATTSSPTHIQIGFGDTDLTEDVTGTLSFAYSDSTTGVTGEDEIKNITINVDEPEPPVTTYHISMATEGTDIEEKELPTDEDYEGTIHVTAKNKILDGLDSVTLKDSNTDITDFCTYDPAQDKKSASLEIPLIYLTNDIEVAVTLIDDPTPQITYTVSFDSKGGLPAPAAQTINAGDPASIPSSPFKDDFSFGGWYTDEDATEYKYDFTRPVISNLTLYARWNKIEDLVTVTFDAGEGTFANGEHTFPIKVDKNCELNLCLGIIHSYGDPTRANNTFAYYTYKDLNKSIGYNDIITNDVTIVANYFLSKNVPYKDLNGIGWDVIKNVAVTNTEDHIKDLFDIGATKDIYFDYSGTTVKHTVQILSFRTDHLHYDEGERTTLSPKFAGITFDFSTLISDKSGNVITTKWDKSSNRNFEGSTLNTLLNKGSDCIFNRLPGDLKGIIEEVDQKVAHGSDYAVEPRYTTKLYPLAYSEMVNESAEGAAAEGVIYGFYKKGGANARIKKDSNGKESIYWLRSPCTEDDYLGNFDYAWAINTSGNAGSSFKYDELYAFAPAFCI